MNTIMLQTAAIKLNALIGFRFNRDSLITAGVAEFTEFGTIEYSASGSIRYYKVKICKMWYILTIRQIDYVILDWRAYTDCD